MDDNQIQATKEVEPSRLLSQLNAKIALVCLLVGVLAVGILRGLFFENEPQQPSQTTYQSTSTKVDGFDEEIDQIVILIGEGDTASATSMLNQILDASPRHVLANYNMGVIAQFDNRLEEAIKFYTQSLVGAPKFQSALYNRGLAYRDSGDPTRAIADLSTVMVINPDAATAAFNLGKLLIEQGDLEKGNAFLVRAKKLDPTLGS